MKKIKILVVEDNKTYLHFVAGVLEQAGYEVLQSEDIWISNLIVKESPALILMDVSLGYTKGSSAVAAIKKRRLGDGITILLHSSEEEAKLAVICKECNADGYVVKDGNERTLLASVKDALRRSMQAGAT